MNKRIARLEKRIVDLKKAMINDPDWKAYEKYIAYYENKIERIKGRIV